MTTTTAPKPFKKGYKYRLYPTPEQRQYLLGLFGANRFLWNHLLAQTEESYQIYATAKRLCETGKPAGDGWESPAFRQEWMSIYELEDNVYVLL